MAVVSMSNLLEAGVHFGHQTKRWNPKMKPYIFTAREDIYIIDLQKTAEKIEEAYVELKKIAENGGTFLFVGTKKQASEVAKEEATRSNSFYVTERWLGGTLTNFRTIRRRVKRLEEIENMEKNGIFDVLPKKEVIGLKKEYEKLNRLLCGIRGMVKIPQALIILDPDYVIPGNDDAVRSVKVVLGVLNNAICEANGLEMVDYVTEEDKKKANKEEKKEATENVMEEALKEDKTVKEVANEQAKEEVLSNKTLTELKNLAKDAGIKGYSAMKKEELVAALTK